MHESDVIPILTLYSGNHSFQCFGTVEPGVLVVLSLNFTCGPDKLCDQRAVYECGEYISLNSCGENINHYLEKQVLSIDICHYGFDETDDFLPDISIW